MKFIKKERFKRIKLITCLALSPVMGFAQGVNFERHKSWDEIIKQAETEHKYIFVDCFATWCGPCKLMDREVYPDKAVGDYMNDKFISVRLQMNKSAADNNEVKNWYGTAATFEASYAISAYPCFLFFSPEGKPLHKSFGAKDVAAFIQLAKEAQDPKKQYYSILANYKPGTLDTAELKGLIHNMRNDRELAGRMAEDYLARIPQNRRGNADDLAIMEQCSYDSVVCKVAVAYITRLDKNGLNNPDDRSLIVTFSGEPDVKNKAAEFIGTLSDAQIYNREMLFFIQRLTFSTADRGFSIFHDHGLIVDAVKGRMGYAENVAAMIIKQTQFDPLFISAKQTGQAPDFEAMSASITRKYGVSYATKVINESKNDWYQYLINNRKETKYWPDYIDGQLAHIRLYGYDTARNSTANNICWYDVFQHAEDKRQLDEAARIMHNVIALNPKEFGYMDTYACLLYKAGNKDEAIQWEENAAKLATFLGKSTDADNFKKGLERMKANEKIWEEKEYLDGNGVAQ